MDNRGFLSYLSYVLSNSVATPSLESVRVVREFVDMFYMDLPSFPLDRDI